MYILSLLQFLHVKNFRTKSIYRVYSFKGEMLIKINNVSKKFNNELLLNIDELEINSGFYMLQGENGCGKSTFIKMLYQITDYTGEIYINNMELSKIDKSTLDNELISYIDQQGQLFDNATCQENFNIILKEYDKEQLKDLLTLLNYQDVFDSKKKIKQLSGGEKQKLQLIIGLLKDVEIYLLDEIDNNLDMNSIEKIVKYLKSYNNKTVIIISHDSEYYDLLNCHVIEFINQKLELNTNENVISASKKIEFNLQQNQNANNQKLIKRMYNVLHIKFTLVNIIIALVLTLFLSNLYLYEQYFSAPDGQYESNNVATIRPPINNPLFYSFGDTSWLQTTPHYFSVELWNYFEENYHIKELVSITSLNGEKNSTGINDGNYNYNIIDDNFAFVHSINPQAVNINTPYSTLRDVEIIAGNYPEDNTNQILVPSSYADKYLSSDYARLIGEATTIDVMKSDLKTMSQADELEFVISGVYKDSEVYKGEQQIVLAYNQEDQIAKENNCSLFADNVQQQACIEQLPEVKDYDYFEQIFDEGKAGLYSGMYVEFTDEESLQQAARDFEEYDEYVYFDSNYTRSHDNNFNYLKKNVYRVIVLSIVIGLIGLLSNYFIIKQYLELDRKTYYQLKCFGVNQDVLSKIIKKQVIVQSMFIIIIYLSISMAFINLLTSFKLLILILGILLMTLLIILVLIIRRFHES